MNKKLRIITIMGLLFILLGLLLILKSIYSPSRVKYNVSFIDDNGKIIYKTKVEKGKAVEKYIPEDKDGAVFIDWYKDTNVFDFKIPIEEDLILYGKWYYLNLSEETYSMTFYVDEKIYEKQEVIKGKIGNIPETPEKDGYIFIGWYYNNDKYKFTTPVTKNIELTAKWEQEKKENNSSTKEEKEEENAVLPSIDNNANNSSSIVVEEDIKLNYTSITLRLGETLKLTYEIIPENTTIKSVQIYCENGILCTIDKDGNIITGRVGSTNIIVETINGITKKIPITIKDNYTAQIKDGKLYIFNSFEKKVSGTVNIQYKETGTKKTITVPKTGYEISSNIEIISILVND